jgi:large subunit ribosomal protein L4
MYKARYYKADGKKGRARDLPPLLFDGVVHEGVLHQVVTSYLANQRQGTASAKTRAAVAGGKRKPWRQKGTGRARQGSIRAVQWEGGGRAFPPIPHSWRKGINRKVKALARRSAFNTRAEAERVVVIDALAFEAPRTAQLRRYLGSVELSGAKVLLLTDGTRDTVYLSARNLPEVEVRAFGHETAYDILWADVIVIEREALDRIESEAVGSERRPEATGAEGVAGKAPSPPGKKASSTKKAAPEGTEEPEAGAEDTAGAAEEDEDA